MLVLAITDLRRLLKVADITAALSVEGLLGTDDVFAEDLQRLRPHPGQRASAANLRTLMAGSEIRESHHTDLCTRVQDAYSLRCAPQVAGAVRDTVEHTARVATVELASAIDNPVITPDDRVESNGNFHGAPIGYALDFLAIGVADLASMAERRTDRFLDASRSNGLPPFLAHDPGVDSGLMIAQYTQAAIVSELKRLASPRVGRLHPQLGDAGGPRLDGLVRRPQAAPGRGRVDPGAGHRADDRRARQRTSRTADPVPRARRGRHRPAHRGRARPRPRPVAEPGDRRRRDLDQQRRGPGRRRVGHRSPR